MKNPPSPETLRKLLRYDAGTDKLFYLARTEDMFEDGAQSARHRCARWNSMYSGKEAFSSVTITGYLIGSIHGKKLYAHRVIWAMETGEWPSDEIDHVNGVRSDNRIQNLRSVSHAVNLRNQKRSANNTSGATGVYWSKGASKWAARIVYGGVSKHLGVFDRFEDARGARKSAEVEHGFHHNHGRKS